MEEQLEELQKEMRIQREIHETRVADLRQELVQKGQCLKAAEAKATTFERKSEALQKEIIELCRLNYEQADALQIAQQKILQLEQQIEQLSVAQAGPELEVDSK